MSATGHDGLRALRAAILALDPERLLDQHALDRVLTTTLGAIGTESDKALSGRFFRELRGDVGAAHAAAHRLFDDEEAAR
jgi:hypothetical protein